MNLLDLFSGIGGFSLAARWAGIETIAFVEIDPFCQKVLEKNFPGIPIYEDITKFDGTPYRGTVDIISGGFPCQSFSCAGKRRGTEDDRYLWPEMFRVIREVHPRWVIAENVPGLIGIEDGMVFERVCLDLESEGYQVQPLIIPACAVNAPHRRDRVWIVAYNAQNPIGSRDRRRDNGNQGECECSLQAQRSDCHAPDTDRQGSQRYGGYGECAGKRLVGEKTWEELWIEVATRLCRMDDGVSEELYKLETSDRVGRLKALGNSIVPQIAFQIFKAIVEIEHDRD